MAEAPIWPVATDALLADTTHLTDAEFGAYVRLMIAQWRNKGQPLDFNPVKLARICGTDMRRWPDRWAAISEFFNPAQLPLCVEQKRIVDDYKDVSARIKQAREAGARGGAANARKTKGRHKAPASNSPQANDKRKGSDDMQSGNSENEATPEADENLSINHEPVEEDISSKPANTASCREGVAADPPAPGLPDQPKQPWVELGEWVLAATGLDQRPRPVPFACVKGWLERWREDQIRDAITACVRRESYDPGKIGGGGLAWFEKAIAEHADRECAEERARIESRFATFTDHDWKTLLTGWARGERWLTHRGPPPNDPKTLVHGYWLDWLRDTHGSLEQRASTPGETPEMPDFLRRSA